MADNGGGGNYGQVGGIEEGAPVPVDLMKNRGPGFSSLKGALLYGAHSAATNTQGVEGYDMRNFHRSRRTAR